MVEGSSDNDLLGEYSIDVSEYYLRGDRQITEYYQLKHSTVQNDIPFQLSDLQTTFEGFSSRFIEHYQRDKESVKSIRFTILTNRSFDPVFKKNLTEPSLGLPVKGKFRSTLEKYTKLSGDELKQFCSLINVEDSHGDYAVQREKLRIEIAQLVAGAVDTAEIYSLIALVSDKVLPDADGKIVKEEVLMRFGMSSEKDLYPADALWEYPGKVIEREHHAELAKKIHDAKNSVIVHAAGGVGKSVFTRQFIDNLPEGSVGIAFDCFGAGRYRNRSETRHGHKVALMQIANELSTKGLCAPLIIRGNDTERDIMAKFLARLEQSIKSIKTAYPMATLSILIDAADNAEMAALEFNQACFAHELLREKLPDGCKLVMLCRTERIQLLQPKSDIVQLPLEPFSEQETLSNLRLYFPYVSLEDASEFHRLTFANPRVQSNAIGSAENGMKATLEKLGPGGKTVDDLISHQLDSAVSYVKDLLSPNFQPQIEAICIGLANLPPNIPLEILAKVSEVSRDVLKSFIADIGRALWLSDSSVQFRDEPTETWFRTKFSTDKTKLERYIDLLEPLASHSSYTSEVLPQLYLSVGQYEKLINIALSDDLLPEDNPIDARNIRVYRLQFAFKAAIKLLNYGDAVKLAMRAGEEVAGDQRQLGLLKQNIDLLATLQSKEKTQEMAFRRTISGFWTGSENVYSASLLSSIEDFKGEARGFLRASRNWLEIYFDENREKKTDRYEDPPLRDLDILEITRAFLNLEGIEGCCGFLLSLRPKQAVARTVADLSRVLIDSGKFEDIEALLAEFKYDPFYVVAITKELHKIGHFPKKDAIERCLDLLCNRRTRIKHKPSLYDDKMRSDLLCFLEACVHANLEAKKILRVLRHYLPLKASRLVYSNHHYAERGEFMRMLSLRLFALSEETYDIEDYLPEELRGSQKEYEKDRDKQEFTKIVQVLFPWYKIRLNVICRQGALPDSLEVFAKESSDAMKGRHSPYDSLPDDLSDVQVSIFNLLTGSTTEEVVAYYRSYIEGNKRLNIRQWLHSCRSSFRNTNFDSVKGALEQEAYRLINSSKDDDVDEISGRYILLARAVSIYSIDDASVYFNDAINIVSKFGDELSQRWEAIVEIAKKTCGASEKMDELAYRFVRVAELVGERLREKHWDRPEALQICARMNPGIGISTLSRWADREIGRFEWLHYPLLVELVRTKMVAPLTAWSLSPFCQLDQLKYYLKSCLVLAEIPEYEKQAIFNDALYRMQKDNSNKGYWSELKVVASANGIDTSELDKLISSLVVESEEEKGGGEDLTREYDPALPWDTIFSKVVISSAEQLEACHDRFSKTALELKVHCPRYTFWKAAINTLKESDLLKFIDALLASEVVDNYDFSETFSRFPIEWANKVGFKSKYRSIINRAGAKYFKELCNSYAYDVFYKSLPKNEDNHKFISEGIFHGLANGQELADAEILFGFVKLAVPFIEHKVAPDILSYSLSRFELHFDKDFGDGQWREALEVSSDVNDNLAGYIWAALGSPKSHVRWKAVHSIIKLGDFNCSIVIDRLFDWLKFGNSGPFGHQGYPFYRMHALQYLLIAVAKIALDNPNILLKHSEMIFTYALNGDHAIIQRAASDAILNIEKGLPGTFVLDEIDKIRQVGWSPFPIKKAKYNYRINSIWHEKNEVKTGIDFHFGWDFDRYWFEPLGGIFGVSGEQIQDLSANVVVNEWGVKTSGYSADPRVGLWNRSSREDNTHHDHGSYPKTDNLDFYQSYHSMMTVAARLVKNMPTVSRNDWSEDKWEDWIAQHYVTFHNGKLLAEEKDDLPHNRPVWIDEKVIDEKWAKQLGFPDIINNVKVEKDGEGWLNLFGWWHEQKDSGKETYSVSSALVSPKTSSALLNALSTCKDCHDFKLPNYGEERMEIDYAPFKLEGWIAISDIDLGIDRFDPYAEDFPYSMIAPGAKLLKKLGMYFCEGKRKFFSKEDKVAAVVERWRSQKTERDEDPDQAGQRISFTVEFLKSLCKALKREIVIKVYAERRISRKYGHDDYRKGRLELFKIFIFSKDGKLRSTEGYH